MRTIEFCPSLESNGHPDLDGSARSVTPCEADGGGQTAFHDAIARFGGAVRASSERCLLVERTCLGHL
jgi:hypothetical protein